MEYKMADSDDVIQDGGRDDVMGFKMTDGGKKRGQKNGFVFTNHKRFHIYKQTYLQAGKCEGPSA